MRLLSWLIGLPVAIVAVLFAVSNKAVVSFALWPLPMTLDAPLYLAILGTLVTGFVLGGLVAWVGQGRNRNRARRLADKVYALETEVKEWQARAATAEKRLAEKTVPVSGEPKGVSTVALPGGTATPRLPTAA